MYVCSISLLHACLGDSPENSLDSASVRQTGKSTAARSARVLPSQRGVCMCVCARVCVCVYMCLQL